MPRREHVSRVRSTYVRLTVDSRKRRGSEATLPDKHFTCMCFKSLFPLKPMLAIPVVSEGYDFTIDIRFKGALYRTLYVT